MIHIDAEYQGLIGDALCAVPYMKYLCDRHGTQAIVTDFNKPVQALLTDYPFIFADSAPDFAEARYRMDLHAAWKMNFDADWPYHMGQFYFAYYGCPVPPIPINLPMHSEPSGLPPGLVLTPYSRTNSEDNNKLWPHERWVEVLRHLRNLGLVDRIYIVGASGDCADPYQNEPGVQVIFDRPLPQILTLLRDSPLVLGLDNGISHLTHLAGVHRHVMIYADCLPPRFAENPRGVHVRGPRPVDIGVSQVLAAAMDVLTGTAAT